MKLALGNHDWSITELSKEILRAPLSSTRASTLLEWIQENSGLVVENKSFRSVSDLIEQVILLLKEKMETKNTLRKFF